MFFKSYLESEELFHAVPFSIIFKYELFDQILENVITVYILTDDEIQGGIYFKYIALIYKVYWIK